jgi:integrase
MKSERRAKGQGSLIKIGKWYYVRFTINGKHKTASLKTTSKVEAERKAAELLEPAMAAKTKEQVIVHVAEAREIVAKTKTVLLNDVWSIFEKSDLRPNSAPGTMGNYRRHWSRFLRWMDSKHSHITTIDRLTPEICRDYGKDLTDAGFSAATHHYHRVAVQLITGTIMKERPGILDENPWKQVPKKEGAQQKRDPFTKEEVQRMFSLFQEDSFRVPNKAELEAMFHIAAFTGLRLMDCALLQWDSVNMRDKEIVVTPEKTKRSHKTASIPLHPELRRMLKIAESWKKEESDHVLPGIAARFEYNASGVRKDAIRVIKTALGREEKSKKPNGFLVQRNRHGFHCFRSFFASQCANQGVPVHKLAEILGDQIRTLEKYYIRADKSHDDKVRQAISMDALKQIETTTQTQVVIAPDRTAQVEAILSNVLAWCQTTNEITPTGKKELAKILQG